MALNIYNIKKWWLMLNGKSVLHVKQNFGKAFDNKNLNGYFNDMTMKVKNTTLFNNQGIPLIETKNGSLVEFPVAIFQYGLGAYDLFLIYHEKKYFDDFINCSNWALNMQLEDGAWDNFGFIYQKNKFGAMCQGEGASLLLRAYKETNDIMYLKSAEKALRFMLTDVSDGGTALKNNNDLILLEYTHKDVVLNGWIFAIFGLYDYLLVKDDIELKKDYMLTLTTLDRYLDKFNCWYGSKYDLGGKICSPFYHQLHISQLKALFLITNNEHYNDIMKNWERKNNSVLLKNIAFIIKVIQKVLEREG